MANEPPEVNCMIGEASGEGLAGMIAIGQAIRNRGNMKGVYGCTAEHIKNESQDTKDLAGWAYIQLTYHPNETPDLVKGGNSWGSEADIKKNHMDQKCVETATVGRHRFFKCQL